MLRVRLAGGGGHGEASQRDVAAVLRDVIEEKMSVAHARDAYGVAVSGSPPVLDAAGTATLRARMRERTSK